MAEKKPRKRNARSTPLPKDIQEMLAEVEEVTKEKNLVTIGAKARVCNRIPTGIFLLDYALLGGLPEGYNIMCSGKESSGKTTNTLKAIAQFQKKYPNKFAAIVDVEGLVDPVWAEKLGVDMSRVVYTSPDRGEQAVDLIEDFLGRKSIGFIFLDSVPACVPQTVLEKSSEDDTMAALARLMGKMCSKVTMKKNAMLKEGHRPTFVYSNQIRLKVGFSMGSPNTLGGGRQINHLPTTKLEYARIKDIKRKDKHGFDVTDHTEMKFKITKIKHGQCIDEGVFRLIACSDHKSGFPEGDVDDVGTVATYAKKIGFIRGGGSTWRLFTENVKDCKDIESFTKFKTLTQLTDFLHHNEEELLTLKKSIIAFRRLEANVGGALPPDGFLLSHEGRVVPLEVATQFLK